MAVLKFFVFLVIPFIFGNETTSQAATQGPHVADVNILLPPRMSHPVEYLLIGSDGCFKWSWDHHDILSVVPELNSSNHCSTRARIKSIAPYSGRKETALYATDVNTGIVIRCKVFIDNISKIKIAHNSIKLDLDGLAILRVRGFDSEDNEFSSLVGLKFMWQLESQHGETSHYLAHVSLRESPLSDCGGLCGDLNLQAKLEQSGYFSDLYVVKGVGIGEEKISATLMEKDLTSVFDSINLTVVEAMLLEPCSPVYVIIGAFLQYNLKVIRQNLPRVVALPSSHHTWFSTNSSVVVMDNSMGLARALSIGVSSVLVEDVRVSKNIIESYVNVVVPRRIFFYAVQLENGSNLLEDLQLVSTSASLYVIAGCRYLISLKVVSDGPEQHDIYITKSDDLRMHDSANEYWKFLPPSDNDLRGSNILAAVSQGTGKITASLNFFDGLDKTKKVIIAEQEVRVCNPIRYSFREVHVKPGNILLPWAPNIFQSVILTATGGCGDSPKDFVWSVSNSYVLAISTAGVVTAIKPGISTAKVVSVYDSSNFDEVVIEVSIPSSMVMLQKFPIETVVGSHLRAAVTMKGSSGEEYYKCDAFHPFIKWMTSSEVFMVVNATEDVWTPDSVDDITLPRPSHFPSCSWARLVASSCGQTMIHATLSKDYKPDQSLQGSQILLKASMTVAAYMPLTVHQVGNGNKFGGYSMNSSQEEELLPQGSLNNLFLAPGSTMDVMLLGGPQRWGKGIEFLETVKTLDDKFSPVSIKGVVDLIDEAPRTMYRVSCPMLGTFYLVFERGNLIGEDHPHPAISDVKLGIMCKVPSTIRLLVDEPDNKKELIKQSTYSGFANTERSLAGPIVIANRRSIRIAAVGIDISGNAFANSSSITLKWELASCDSIAKWDDHISVAPVSTWERTLTLLNQSGECIVRANAFGCSTNVIDFYPGTNKLESVAGAVRIQVVTALSVDPSFLLMFCSPFAQANLLVVGGSCFVETSVNNSKVIEVVLPSSDFKCSKVVLLPKEIGTALVTVSDVGLVPPVVAFSVVRVADIDWIKIVADDEINLMEGRSSLINISAGTNDGLTFDSTQYAYMKIRVHVEEDIVKVEINDSLNSTRLDGSKQSFTLIAKHIGITSLYVSARQFSGLEVISKAIKIEVYKAPRIFPGNVFLTPGATYTVVMGGGPTGGAYVEYISLNEKVVSVDHSGKLTALVPGSTEVLSKVYHSNGNVLCEAFVAIKVDIPTFVKLNAQSDQIDIKLQLPIYPMFVEGNLFSFYKLCKGYKWTIENPQLINFHNGVKSETQPVSLHDEVDMGFYQILLGRVAGRTQVSVSFTCNFTSSLYSHIKSYNASLPVLVAPSFPISLGSQMTWILPPYYTSSALLPNSPEPRRDSDRKAHKGTVSYSLIKSCGDTGQHGSIAIKGDRIETSESGEIACIQEKDRTNGRTEIAVCLRVAEVAQMRINIGDSSRKVFLAVGDQTSLELTYFDVLGNPFHEVYEAVHLEAETNHHDVVAIDFKRNGSHFIDLQGRKRGQALVRVVMDDNPLKSDYILISVGAHLQPENPLLQLKDSVQFFVEGSDEKAIGHWMCANQSVLSIDARSGKAEAVNVGSTQVIYETDDTRLQTSVTVSYGNALSLHAPHQIITNIGDALEGYKFFVKVSGTNEGLADNGNHGIASFSCKVEPEFLGHAQPGRDRATSKLYCLFLPYSPEQLVRSGSKLKGMKPYLSFAITASDRSSNISATASSLFVGGFSVVDGSLSVKQLTLTSHSDRVIITIIGNTDVSVDWDKRNLLDVELIEREDFGLGGRVRFEVKLLWDKKPYPVKDSISFVVPATGQKYVTEVTVDPPSSNSLTGEALWSPIIIVVFFVSLVFGALVVMHQINNRPHQTRRPPSAPAPATPEPLRRASISDTTSPRTPEPFIEYVRKTIDETPYYRREPRKRFNIQNTL